MAFLQKYGFTAGWKKPLANAGCAALLLKGAISWNPEAGAHNPISS